MRLMSKLLLLPIVLSGMACATRPPNVILGLGPIICPQSLLEHEAGQGEIDPAFVATLTEEGAGYILQREAGHEASLDAANSKADDALDACADYNNRLQSLQAESGE